MATFRIPTTEAGIGAGAGGIGRRRRGGFTLLELVVVIFIMILMAALAVASFHKFLETERIRLAGGSLDSSIRLARQYAMSKRVRCMVELVTPDPPMSTSTSSAGPIDSCTLVSIWLDSSSPGVLQINGGYQRYVAYAKFSLPVLTGGAVLERAVLKFRQNGPTIWGPLPVQVTVKGLENDTWSGASLTWRIVNVNGEYPADAGTLGVLGVAAADTDYEVDVTSLAQVQTDGLLSVQFTCPDDRSGDNHGLNALSATLELTVATPAGEVADHLPRQVRVLPFRRAISPLTGGLSWTLDQDANALQVVELPRNVVFVLTPGKAVARQYDPAVLPDKCTPVSKTFFLLTPDGACSAAAPDMPDDPVGNREHWMSFSNTVILRNTDNDDLCLLYVPPATSFTRQRYLFAGAEVDEFRSAHSPYALW